MTTKTDLGSVTLLAAEVSACHGKAVNPVLILNAAKQSAQELANLIGELLKVIPAGANATTLTSIKNALL